MDVKKSRKGPLLHFLTLWDSSKFSFFSFRKKFRQGPSSIFLIFCNRKDVRKSQMVLFFEIVSKPKKRPEHILKSLRFLSLKYSADFGSSRLVEMKNKSGTMESYRRSYRKSGKSVSQMHEVF